MSDNERIRVEPDEAAIAAIDVGSLTDTVKAGTEERPFLGEIIIDQYEPGERGPKWHLGVKPLSFTLSSRTGAFHNWSKVPFQLDDAGRPVLNDQGRPVIAGGRGEYGRIKSALKSVGIDGAVGEGALIGKVAWFVQRVITYGRNQATGETIQGGRPSLIAVRRATTKDIVEAGSADALSPDERNGHITTTFTQEQAQAALDLMAGRKPTEYIKLAGTMKDLETAVKRAVMDGTAQDFLVANGLAVEKGGVLERA